MSPAQSLFAPDVQLRIGQDQIAPLAALMDEAVREGKIPGAVLLIGHQGKVIYRRAFGFRELRPRKLPMTEDTIFDVASLTKVVVTTTAVMQLVEEGKLKLDAPVARYWSSFQAHGKGRITIRQLLTHYSGLRPNIGRTRTWSGYGKAMKMIIAERPVSPPDSRFLYSDINFVVLGEIIRRVSGKSLDVYSADRIFRPLGMIDSGFRPLPALHNRIAPTRLHTDKRHCGKVHDPMCLRMGGVTGHAGLFSTVDDLSVFSQMLLNGGSIHGMRILGPSAVEEMTTPQSPPGEEAARGLGWDLDAPFSSNREILLPVGSYGHLGYTGTAIWIDPVTHTFIILLTNRVHMGGGGDVKELRTRIKKIIADAIGTLSSDQVLAGRPSLRSYYKIMEKRAVHRMHNP